MRLEIRLRTRLAKYHGGSTTCSRSVGLIKHGVQTNFLETLTIIRLDSRMRSGRGYQTGEMPRSTERVRPSVKGNGKEAGRSREVVQKSRRIETGDHFQRRSPLDLSAIGINVVCSDSENAESRGPMRGQRSSISCEDRPTVERQVAKYASANGTREPHGATSRNVEK
ncbi:hypothetical protein AOQ84DRAFT_366071 [Glonium stellatum]|uniref:Uncharacterized protein n=1 Tax=Glonium stellatum TaxID=574774 RepID=A0A8E2EXF6_9PEZI|nr:hypothetical protein AOQ84DRAFT_366071 [Glonium stellatum]